MKISVEHRPVIVDQNGNEVNISSQLLVERVYPKFIFSVRDIVPEGEMHQGSSIEVEPLSEHITKLVHAVMDHGDNKLVQNLYWELGLCLRSITSEENATALVEALMKGEAR